MTAMVLLILIPILLFGMIVVTIAVQDAAAKPFKVTYLFLGFVCIQWGLYLTGIYASVPEDSASWLWDATWIGTVCIGFVASILEFRKSMLLSVLLLGFTGVQLLFFLFSLFISRM
ncbi:hypothetical protein LG275_08025 [Chryseomicrobium palamuruense]